MGWILGLLLAPAQAAANFQESFALRDYRETLRRADEALSRDPADFTALYYRAAAHNLLGDYPAAVEDATRGLASAPFHVSLHFARALAYNHLGRYEEAIADAQHSLEIDPENPYARGNRAYAYEQLGDYDAMLEDYRAAAAASPKFEWPYRDALKRRGRAKPASRGLRTFLLVSLAGALSAALAALQLKAWRARGWRPTVTA